MTAAVSRRVDDEGLPLPPPVHGKAARWLLRVLAYGEAVMFLAIAVALLTIAVVVFVRGLHDLVLPPAREPFQVTVTRAVNSVLFIVVVLELLRMIVAVEAVGRLQAEGRGAEHDDWPSTPAWSSRSPWRWSWSGASPGWTAHNRSGVLPAPTAGRSGRVAVVREPA